MQPMHVALVFPGMPLAAGIVHALVEHLDKRVSASILLNSRQEQKALHVPQPTPWKNQAQEENT